MTGLGAFVARASSRGELVVQPRMGFSDPRRMREGLLATKAAVGTTIGTLTLDSYTRTGDHVAAARALARGVELNGYPLVAHGVAATRALVDTIQDASFPVQVRHGSASPYEIFHALIGAGMHATEGGPVSYCLPYSRVPLASAAASWADCCDLLASARGPGIEPHLECFGGCMQGQLCPPGLLVALSVLEGLFFRQHGLRSISLSYTQQTNAAQDGEAILALRWLAGELLADIDWHVVLYAYMGVYPRTRSGARGVLVAAAELARATGAERLIVKTVSEAYRIPTIAENVQALELAASVKGGPAVMDAGADNEVYPEARAIVDAVLQLSDDVGDALVRAFHLGLLDVPYCLHIDNRGEAASYIDPDGRLRWARVGSIPVPKAATRAVPRPVTSTELIAALTYLRRRFDDADPPASVEAEGASGTPGRLTEYQRCHQPMGADVDTTPRDRAMQHPLPTPRDHLTSAVTRTTLRVKDRLLAAAREFLAAQGFVELLAPIIGPVTDPGVRGSKQVDVDYYGHRFKLMTSGILYKQASLLVFDKIFNIAPNVRLEPLETAATHRHLAEFHQLDVEIAGASRDEVMTLAERLFTHVVTRVAEEMPAELIFLGRDPDALRTTVNRGFDRISHRSAVDTLRYLEYPQSPDAEIDWQGEEILSGKADVPFFVIDYPKGSRGFYDRESRTESGVLRNFDLVMPEGYGELASGSEREFEYQRLITRMRETGENPAKYRWYLDLARKGLPPSAGFGIGVERLVRYVAGLDAVWRATAFPKMPGVVSP